MIDSAANRAQLRDALTVERAAVDRFLETLGRPESTVIELIGHAEELGSVTERRMVFTRRLREEVSDQRRREEDRSIRQFVLRALEAVGLPQQASFVQEYVWATDRVDLETRGFGALRRDEARSWRRRPGHRVAYIVPILNPDGHAQARWMARSDWSLSQRILVPGLDRLADLEKVVALFAARDSQSRDASDPVLPLLRRYAAGISEAPPAAAGASQDAAWLRALKQAAESEIRIVKGEVVTAQLDAAKGLEGLDEEQQLWGR